MLRGKGIGKGISEFSPAEARSSLRGRHCGDMLVGRDGGRGLQNDERTKSIRF